MFIFPDWPTLLLQLINFAVFFALLNVLFLRPVGKAIAKRRQYIDSVTADYAKYQAEATSLREQADRVREDARREAAATIARARARASDDAAALSARYAATVQETVERAQREAQAELARARTGEDQLVGQLARAMVERTLGTAVR